MNRREFSQQLCGAALSGAFAKLAIAQQQTGDTSVMHVRHVFTVSPAARAGLRVGDEITAINGKTFKNDADFSNRLAKINDPTFTLSISRDGQPLTLTVQRETAPAVGTPEYASLKSEAEQFKQQP